MSTEVVRRRRRRRLGLYVAATLLGLWVVVPMYLIAPVAFRPPSGVYQFPQSLLPTNLSLETMRFFLGYAGLLDALLRSLAVAAITLVLALAIGTPAGYALARFAFRGRGAYRLVILSTRAFPVVILSIPWPCSSCAWAWTTPSGRWRPSTPPWPCRSRC